MLLFDVIGNYTHEVLVQRNNEFHCNLHISEPEPTVIDIEASPEIYND